MADGKRSRTGIYIVVALIAVGVLAAMLTRSYWRGVIARTWGTDDDAPIVVPGVDAKPQAPASADFALELQAVEESFTKTIKDKSFSNRIVRAAERLVARFPAKPEARRLLAQVYIFGNERPKAYDQLVACLEINKQQAEVQILAGTIALDLKQPDKAIAHYRIASGIRADDPAVRVQLASAYATKRELHDAEMTLLEALRLDPAYHKAYEILSDVYATQGKVDMALSQIQKAIDTTPIAQRASQVGYLRKRSNLLRRMNKPEAALQGLRESLTKEERENPEVVEDVARCWAMMGKPAEAAKAFESAQQSNSGEWRLAEGAARWWIMAGDLPAAKRQVEILRRINSRRPELADLEKKLAEAATQPGR